MFVSSEFAFLNKLSDYQVSENKIENPNLKSLSKNLEYKNLESESLL
jgi:hypothetical protein